MQTLPSPPRRRRSGHAKEQIAWTVYLDSRRGSRHPTRRSALRRVAVLRLRLGPATQIECFPY